jgi:hypothetical protein
VNPSPSIQYQRLHTDELREESSDRQDDPPKVPQEPLPLRAVLTREVVISVANYATLTLLAVVSMSLIPLIWSTGVEFGGLNLSPASIGLNMSMYEIMSGIFQFAAFPRAVGRFGPRRVFIASVTACGLVYAMFPLENLALRYAIGGGSGVVLRLLIFLQLWSLSVSEMGFSKFLLAFSWVCGRTTEHTGILSGAVFMFMSFAAPNRRSLGAINGFAQTVVSIQRAIGPALADWLFAFSLTNNILGGRFIYVVLLALLCVAYSIAVRLPRQLWTHSGKYSRCT